MPKKSALGKGLSSLLSDYTEDNGTSIIHIDIEKVKPSKHQPRKKFDSQTINNLAESVKKHGIINPIIVIKGDDDNYEIIAGERRWKAAKIAGLDEIPVIVKKDIDEKTKFELSLIENLQREDLNPIEEAAAFQRLIEAFNYTHDQVAKSIGKNRTYITNTLRLLKLSDYVKELLIEGKLTSGHCKLLVVFNEDEQKKLADLIINKNLSVREIEDYLKNKRKKVQKKKSIKIEKDINDKLNLFSKKYKLKIDLKLTKNNKPKLVLHFKDKEELKKILEDLTK